MVVLENLHSAVIKNFQIPVMRFNNKLMRFYHFSTTFSYFDIPTTRE